MSANELAENALTDRDITKYLELFEDAVRAADSAAEATKERSNRARDIAEKARQLTAKFEEMEREKADADAESAPNETLNSSNAFNESNLENDSFQMSSVSQQ